MSLRSLVVVVLVACGKSDEPAPKAEEPKPVEKADKPAARPAPAEPKGEIHDARCEGLRDKYLAWEADRAKSAIATVDAKLRGELEAQSAKELALAKVNFVGACVELGDAVDGSCFEKRGAADKRCRQMVNALMAKMMRR